MQELREWTYEFSKNGKPVAHAKSGEVLKFIVNDGLGNQIQHDEQLLTDIDFTKCNGATGPLYVDGAEPGDALAVDILNIDVKDHGACCTIEDLGPLWPSCELRTHIVSIKDGYALFNGIKWSIDPMIGVIGTAPDGDDVPTGFVFNGGGNMDSRKIRKGATVWFPVRVPGALLEMGDLHATMGDGEVVGTGIEIEGEIIVRVRLLKKFKLNWPVTETKDAWFVNTRGATCDEAIEYGYKELQRLISKAYGWDMTDTAMYISMRGFLESNQACLTSDEGGDTFRVGTPKVADKPRLIG
jgi:amidase